MINLQEATDCLCCKGTLLGHGQYGVQQVLLCKVSFQSLSHLMPDVTCFQPFSAWVSCLDNFGLFLLCLWCLQSLRPVKAQVLEETQSISLFSPLLLSRLLSSSVALAVHQHTHAAISLLSLPSWRLGAILVFRVSLKKC